MKKHIYIIIALLFSVVLTAQDKRVRSQRNYYTSTEVVAAGETIETPTNGYVVIYKRDNGLWYQKDDAGVETLLFDNPNNKHAFGFSNTFYDVLNFPPAQPVNAPTDAIDKDTYEERYQNGYGKFTYNGTNWDLNLFQSNDDKKFTHRDETGQDYIQGSLAGPQNAPANPDGGDVHLEVYDNALVFFNYQAGGPGAGWDGNNITYVELGSKSLYQGKIPAGNYDFTAFPPPTTGNAFIDSAPTDIKSGTTFIAEGDGLFTLDPNANPFLVYEFTEGDLITVIEDAANWSVAKLNINENNKNSRVSKVECYSIYAEEFLAGATNNGGGGTGSNFLEVATFTVPEDGDYNLVHTISPTFSGSNALTISTGQPTAPNTASGIVFTSAGDRLTVAEPSKTYTTALVSGTTYYLSVWSGGGSNADKHEVSIANSLGEIKVFTLEDGSQYAFDSSNNEIDITGGVPLTWEKCLDEQGTVTNATEALTTTNGIDVEIADDYILFPDGTTFADKIHDPCAINEYIHNIQDFKLAITHEGDGGTTMTFNVNGVPVTYNNLENATDAGAGQVNFNSGVNGVFDRKASTVESIKKVGDYFELIKPGTPSFDSEWIEITTNTDNSQPEVFNNLYRLQFTQTTFTLRDKTDVVVHTSTPENATYRITRTLSGFEIKKNGVVVYKSPIVCNDFVPKNEKETDLTQWLKTFTRLNGAEEVEQVVVNGRIASRLRDPGNQWSRYETTAQVPNDRPQKLLVEVGKQLGSTQTYYIRATYPSNTGDLQINLSTGVVVANNINAGITPTDVNVKDLGDTWLITAIFPPSTEYVNWWHGPALQSEAESGYVDIFQLKHDYNPFRCEESTTTLLPTTFTVTTGAAIGGGVIVLGGAGAIGGTAERLYEVENIGKKHTLTFDHLFNGNAGQDTFFSYEVIENGTVIATGNYEANSATPVTETADFYPTDDVTIKFIDENPPGGGPSSDIRVTAVNIEATCIPFTQQAVETNKDFLLEDIGNATATQNIDWSSAYNSQITLTADTTLTFTNPNIEAGMMYLTIIQDATGGHLITLPSNVAGDLSLIDTSPNSEWLVPIYFTTSNNNPRYKL